MNSTDPSFIVRKMIRADLDTAFEFCVEENWNPGKFDPDSFFAADPNGFFIGELDGVPVGSVSGVAYDAHFGFIGIYILRPQYRGQGFGLKLFNTAMDYLGSRCVGLDGVIAQQENYRLAGFKDCYRHIRYQGVGGGTASGKCVSLTSLPEKMLLDYDLRHFLHPREAFLRYWIRQPESTAVGIVENGEMKGFGVLRARLAGFQIGPLFADTPEIAEILFTSLAAARPGQTIFIDPPEANREAVALAERHGMQPIFETARMYTRSPPELPVSQIFSVTSLELG